MWPLYWTISCSDHSWFPRYTITQKEFCFSWNRAVVVLISEICAHWLFSTLLARLFNQGNFWLVLLVEGPGRRWEGKRERSQTMHFLCLTPGSLLKRCLHSGPQFLSEGCWPTLALPRLPPLASSGLARELLLTLCWSPEPSPYLSNTCDPWLKVYQWPERTICVFPGAWLA